MSAKDIFIDFINYSFMILIIILFFIFFVLGDRVGIASRIMINLVPLGSFCLILLIKIKLARGQLKRKTKEDDLSIILYLTYIDKIKMDIITFSLPITIISIALIEGEVNLVDIIQALVAFLIVFTLSKYIFNKKN